VAVAAKTSAVGVNVPLADMGTASAGGANTLTDGTKAWAVNGFAGKVLHITGGTGSGQAIEIASNTATQITVTTNWATPPDNTSTYEVRENLHVALYDGGATPRLLAVTDETTDQALTSGNPLNIAAWSFGFPNPV